MPLLQITMLLSALAASAPAPYPAPTQQTFDMVVTSSPIPVSVEGTRLLRYELHLTNFGRTPLTLRSVDVVDTRLGTSLVSVRGNRLAAATDVLRAEPGTGGAPLVAPGQRAMLYLDFPIAPDGTPEKVHHRIEFDDGSKVMLLSGGETQIRWQQLTDFGPPLRGGPWAAVYDPAMRGGHRRVFQARSGRARIPGRFAIDWLPARDGPGPGADVLAVADGMVVAMHDGEAEPVGGASGTGAAGTEAGNYIVLAVRDGQFVHFQHLQPGLPVRVGQRVRRGQVIGKLGSTGQVTAPHLHLHVSDSAELQAAEGKPFSLRSGVVVGKLPSAAAADRREAWTPLHHRRLGGRYDDLPPPNSIVVFP